MSREAIILAGGLGTRLRETVPDFPKCMAPVAGHPFLTHVIRYLLSQEVSRFVFSLGFKHEIVLAYLERDWYALDYSVVIEDTPLQTGGAIALAMQHCQQDQVLVVNGDTLYRASLEQLYGFHHQHHAACSIVLKHMTQADRYGRVEMDDKTGVTAFVEKQPGTSGWINAGMYLLDRNRFMQHAWPQVFSFEKAYLEKQAGSGQLWAQCQEGYFIDIGIPEDYARAQEELKTENWDMRQVDEAWTLFLDRDGVININKDASYVYDVDEFVFCEGAREAIRYLHTVFRRIIVITNQRGVGLGLMTGETLDRIHSYMRTEIERSGGRLDEILYCDATDDKDWYRKPNPGMGFRARTIFPDIDFSRAVMVGDKNGDVLWGRNLGARTVRILPAHVSLPPVHEHPDAIHTSLWEWAEALRKSKED